jgi:hemolysin III
MDAPVAVPRLRGWIHQVAFFWSIPAGVILIALARGPSATAVVSVYAATLTLVFGASAAYHRVSWSPRGRSWMKRLDHSMIYALIAGSYTPVAVLALHGPWEIVVLSVAWAGAAVGVAMKLARPDGLRLPSAILYMALGWLALVALPQLVRGLRPAEFALMVVGGVLYTAGAIVLARRRPDPRPATFGYHEIWHAFQVAAAGCHFAMILLIVRVPERPVIP